MEVHPPEHGIHSWRDFFVHIGTIVIGLLIAIGLEQSVEALHHRHLRTELEHDMREEAEANVKALAERIDTSRSLSRWDGAFIKELRDGKTEGGALTVMVPRREQLSFGDLNVRHTVWDVATANGSAAFVTPQQAALYTLVKQSFQYLDDYQSRPSRTIKALAEYGLSVTPEGKTSTLLSRPKVNF